MFRNIGVMLGLALFMAAAQAGEAVDLVALATTRGKAETALRGFEPYNRDIDERNSGWSQLWFKIDNAHTECNDVLNAELQKETHRPDETRNNATIEDIQKKMQDNDRAYNLVRYQTATVMSNNLNAVRAQHNALKSGFDQLPGSEQQFKAARMDLTPLKSIYEAIEKRDMELQSQAKEIMDTLAKMVKEWEDRVTAAKALFPARKDF